MGAVSAIGNYGDDHKERIDAMRTAVREPEAETVLHVSESDAKQALAHALQDAGLTLPELMEQGRTGHFDDLDARMAWHVLKAVGTL